MIDRAKSALKGIPATKLARETKFEQRKGRRLSACQFLWTIILGGAASGSKASFASMARYAEMLILKPLTRQAIFERITKPAAAAFMVRTFQFLLARLQSLGDRELPGSLARFADVTATDSTSIRLVDRLAKKYPACRTNVRKAALKIHANMSLKDVEVESLRITPDRTHDRKAMKVGEWIRNRLLLFDLGYFDYGLFLRIIECGGAFLTRLKETANGVIVHARQGCAKRHVGGLLSEAFFTGDYVDLDIDLGRGLTRMIIRVVGTWNSESERYHWYITSLTSEDFTVEEVAEIYRLRWQIELLFKEWKSVCGLGYLDSGNEHAVLALLYASLCLSILSRIAMVLATGGRMKEWLGMSPRLAATVVCAHALDLGRVLTHRSGVAVDAMLIAFLDALRHQARAANGRALQAHGKVSIR